MISISRKSIVNLFLLGAYEIALDGTAIAPPPTMKARSLLAYLALRRDETIRRETLMNEFWTDAEPTSARNNLKTTLSSIRRAFRAAGADPDTILKVTRDAVRWIAPGVVDSRDFERCSPGVDDERRCAIATYRGEFSPGDSSEWAQDVRNRLALRFEHMLRMELASHPTPQLAERLLALDPFSDEAYTALIEHALRSGDGRTAQAIYRRYVAALEEIEAEPSHDLAARVGLRKGRKGGEAAQRFYGRTEHLAEIERFIEEGVDAIVLSGISGMGKTALAREAVRRLGAGSVDVIDVTAGDLEDAGAALLRRLATSQFAILCALPDVALKIREYVPDTRELVIEPLTYDEVAVAVRLLFADAGPQLTESVWRRSRGYPLVLRDIFGVIEAVQINTIAVERLRLSRDLERRFEMQLNAAGSEVAEVAALLALEPRLDNDDLASLLNWNAARVSDARERLGALGVAYPFYAEAALRLLSRTRRECRLRDIAERLKLHEDPNAKVRLAEHFIELGHRRNAANAYLEAATAFAAASAWEHAVRSFDAGIAALEDQAMSDATLDLLRRLRLARGRALYQQGSFIPAVRSLEEVIEISSERDHPEERAQALITMGHALVRADLFAPAWGVAQQAAEEATRAGDVSNELRAQHLTARVLRDQVRYDESIDVASKGYERAMKARQWPVAASFASLITEISRRLLRFSSAFYWSQRQLEAATLASPLTEAEARHMFGSVKASVFRHEEALAEFRHALPLIEQHRRRHALSATPVEQLEWMMHHALAHTYVAAGDFGNAVAESEWLAQSPWTLNSALSSWQAASVTVDARLGAGSERDVAAANVFLERVPAADSEDHRSCLDDCARARVAARTGSKRAPELLHKAFASLTVAGTVHGDQVHPYFARLSQSARGIDDRLAARAAEAAHLHEQRVIDAAGELWGSARADGVVQIPEAVAAPSRR